MVGLFSTFLYCFPCHFTLSSTVSEFPFFSILASTCYFLPFRYQPFCHCEMISHCGFDCISLIMSDAEHIFTCLLAFCVFFKKKSLFISSAHLKKSGSFLLLLTETVLYIILIVTSYRVYDLQLSPPIDRLFSFHWQFPFPCKRFRFDVITVADLVLFPFLRDGSSYLPLRLMPKTILPVFCSGSFMVSGPLHQSL